MKLQAGFTKGNLMSHFYVLLDLTDQSVSSIRVCSLPICLSMNYTLVNITSESYIAIYIILM